VRSGWIVVDTVVDGPVGDPVGLGMVNVGVPVGLVIVNVGVPVGLVAVCVGVPEGIWVGVWLLVGEATVDGGGVVGVGFDPDTYAGAGNFSH
jgi:hypothetical protein